MATKCDSATPMRRRTDVSIPCCALSVRERLVCDDMKQATGLTSDADLMRLGLWHLARHLDMPRDAALFGLRRAKTRRGPTRGAR